MPPGNIPPPPRIRTQLQLMPVYSQVDCMPLSVQALAFAGAVAGQAGLFGTPVEPPTEPPERPPVEVLPPAPGLPPLASLSSAEPPQAATNAKPVKSKQLIP